MITKLILRVVSLVGRVNALFYTKLGVRMIRAAYCRGLYRRRFRHTNMPNIMGEFNNLLGPEYIKIGKDVVLGRNVVLTAWGNYREQCFYPSIKIGARSMLQDFAHITAINKIEIGEDVLTGRWVTITDNGHGETDRETLNSSPIERRLVSKGPVKIGNKVWIGDKVTILPGVTVGEGAVIAANAVVSKNVPPYCVVAGNPARIVRDNRQ